MGRVRRAFAHLSYLGDGWVGLLESAQPLSLIRAGVSDLVQNECAVVIFWQSVRLVSLAG
jgi:hypothetical protein